MKSPAFVEPQQTFDLLEWRRGVAATLNKIRVDLCARYPDRLVELGGLFEGQAQACMKEYEQIKLASRGAAK